MNNVISKSGLVWQIAELLRGGWKQYEYQDVILPLVVLKRLDAVLAPTKQDVIRKYNEIRGKKINPDPILKATAKAEFYNTSPYDFTKLTEDSKHIGKNFRNYISGFSENIRDIVVKFDFEKQLERLEGGDLLFQILETLNRVDLTPSGLDNHEMGSLFEELIRKFAEQSNETAGEHFTPREVIKLMVEILFDPDRETLKKPHIIKTIYDCASGTGGMLTVSKDLIREKINPDADIFLFGQELNPATYAICKSDMLIKGEDPDRIKGGEKDHTKASTLSNDQFWGQEFDYLITNPPFGVDWKKDKSAVEREAARGYAGRFGAGLPRISDGQLLFLQHLLFKMRSEKDGGSRVAIVFNGSPLFTGDAGGGESEIRRWILEHDWLEAIVALPDQLFYNTGISTYIWFLSNRKSSERRGRVQLIDARSMYGKMRKSLGNKRNEITDANRAQVVDIYRSFQESEFSKIFTTTDFAYRQIVVERPLRLNFQASRERLERLKNRLDLWPDTHVLDGINKDLEEEISPGLKKALLEPVKKGLVEAEDLKRKMCSALDSIGDELYRSQRKFEKAFDEKWEAVGFKPGKAIRKVMLEALSERDPQADICLDVHGNPEPDSNLRDTENVPWGEDVREYFTREVLPFVPDAWINESVRDEKDGELGRVGYEIPLTRYFYTYQPPRPLEAIESDIANVEGELAELLKKL